MKLRAVWAGLKHDVTVLVKHEPHREGYVSAWDPTLPKGTSSYGPVRRRCIPGRREPL